MAPQDDGAMVNTRIPEKQCSMDKVLALRVFSRVTMGISASSDSTSFCPTPIFQRSLHSFSMNGSCWTLLVDDRDKVKRVTKSKKGLQ